MSVLSTLFLIAFFLNSNIEVKSYFSKSDTLTSREARLRVKISNRSGFAIAVPNRYRMGLKNDPIADFIFEFETQKGDSAFQPLEIRYDYTSAYFEPQILELKDQDSVEKTFNIANFFGYEIPIGKYRVRALYKASTYNKAEDVYSNWSEFSIKEVLPLNKGVIRKGQ